MSGNSHMIAAAPETVSILKARGLECRQLGRQVHVVLSIYIYIEPRYQSRKPPYLARYCKFPRIGRFQAWLCSKPGQKPLSSASSLAILHGV